MVRDKQSRIFRTAIFCACFSALYYVLNLPEVIFITGLGFTAWYPAAGLCLAATLGLSPWYGLLIYVCGPIVGDMVYGVPIFSWSGVGGSLAPAAYYALAAYVLRGPWKIDVSLRRRRDVLRYFAVSVVAAAGSTAFGVWSLMLDHGLPLDQYWKSTISWFGGEIIGVVGIAPFLLIHVLPSVRKFMATAPEESAEPPSNLGAPPKPVQMWSTLEYAGQLASIPVALYLVLSRLEAGGHLFFLLFLPILWIAMRKGVRRVVTGNVALIMGMVIGLRLFTIVPDNLFSISLTLLLMSAAGLIVGSMVSEQYRQARDLRDQTVYLNSLVENSPQPIVFLDLDRKMRVCNDAFLRMYQFTREDMAATPVDKLIWPPEMEEQGNKMFADAASGRTVRVTTRRRRKDGVVLDVELICVPLIVDARTQGVCWIYSDISERLRAAKAAQQHAEQLDQMVRELKIHNTEMALLSELNNLLQCCATSREAYAAVGQSAQKLFPVATSGVLYVVQPEQKILESVAEWGPAHVSESVFEPLTCWSFRRGRPHWSEFPGGGVVCSHLKDPTDASYLCVPMMAGNQNAGVLHLQINRSGPERETPGFEALMKGVENLAVTAAGQIALGIVSLRLREELEKSSIRDPLTGLFNRRILTESLQREILRSRRKNSTVALVFIDLDHFKKFNDTFGHAAGDEVLVRMARLFRAYYRAEDIVCRYGGEEFAVVMPEARAADALARADGLRAEAGQVVIQHEGRTLDRVTLSIGVAVFPEHASTPEELLRAADECLYRSKAAGRNRVTLAESSSEPSHAPAPAVKQLT